MSGTGGDSLAALLRRLNISPAERRAFALADTASSLTKVRVLTAAAIFYNTLAVDEFGGRLGQIRARGLVEQVIGAAFQTYGGLDPHPGPFEKAGMLLRGVTQGHPFTDGNKRTGFLVAALYLDIIGYPLPDPLPLAGFIDLCFRVSSGTLRDVTQMADELARLWQELATN